MSPILFCCPHNQRCMRVVQKVLSLTKILDFSYTSYLCMGLISREIKITNRISFSSCIRTGGVFANGSSFLVRFRTFVTTPCVSSMVVEVYALN